MRLYEEFKEILKIQKLRRCVSFAGFYNFTTLIVYAYVNNTTRAGYSRADQYYASYPAGTELLTDTSKLYKAALGNCFEAEEWGPFEFCVMTKHFDRQGKSPYAYHAGNFLSLSMKLYEEFKEILKIQKLRRCVSFAGFYSFTTLIVYAYVNNTTRAGYSRADQYYASYPAGTELLTDTSKLYKAALGNCFEAEEWGPFEFCVMTKHFDRQGKSPYAYHAQYMAHLLSHGQLDGSG